MIHEFGNPMPVETPLGYGMLVYVRDGGETKMCFEHIVCCTGTHFHTCVKCREAINRREYVYSHTEPEAESNA